MHCASWLLAALQPQWQQQQGSSSSSRRHIASLAPMCVQRHRQLYFLSSLWQHQSSCIGRTQHTATSAPDMHCADQRHSANGA
eukprot:scaffold321886_cov24-Tisochrysis_lutea.AAC.1